jgi:RNA-binding protein
MNYLLFIVMVVRLKHIGTLKTISTTGNLIVKAKFTPNLNDEVAEKTSKVIGKVVKVFGPVSKPYVAVKPSVDDKTILNKLIGLDVYIKQK